MVVTKETGMKMTLKKDDIEFEVCEMEVRLEGQGEFFTLSLHPKGSPVMYLSKVPEEILKEIRGKE